MQEFSRKSYIRSKSLDYGIIPPIFDKKDFHIMFKRAQRQKMGRQLE